MPKSLLLIDGSSLLCSCFYGNLPANYKFAKTEKDKDAYLPQLLHTSDGQYTNGVFTMMTSLLNILKKQKPTHMAVAFDLTRMTFREKLFGNYKGQRKEIRNELKSQFTLSQQVLKEMNIPVFAFTKYEADDILGTLSKKFGNDILVNILTKDQDALQLIDNNIRVWLMTSKYKEMYKEVGLSPKLFNIPNGVFEFTPLYVEHFYGLSPIQIIDKKSIEGDTSDNIPGVKGVGEKAVVPLLQEFKTLEGIYDYIENTSEKDIKELFKLLGIKRSPLSNLIKESETELVGKKSAFLSKILATIKCDIPELEGVVLDSLKTNIDENGMRNIFKKLEFTTLLK